MMKLKERYEEIYKGNTFLYPCSGMDIQTLIQLLSIENKLFSIDNFVLIDLNVDDPENDMANGYQGFHRQQFFENKLGLHNISIIEREEYDVADIEDLVIEQLTDYSNNQIFRELLNRVVEPKAIRYLLHYNNHKFVLYLIHYEATIILEKIKSIKSTQGLILKLHVNGGFTRDYFMNKMIEFNPSILVCDDLNDKNLFSIEYEEIEKNTRIYRRELTEVEQKEQRIFNLLKRGII